MTGSGRFADTERPPAPEPPPPSAAVPASVPASVPARVPGAATVVRPAPSERAGALRARRRRRRLVAGLVVMVLLVVAAGVRVARDGWGSLTPSGSGAPAASGAPTLLLAWPAGTGDGAVLTLVGVTEGTTLGSVLLMPGRTQVEVPSLGSRTLGETLRTAGAEATSVAIENALGYPVADVVALDAEAWTEVLEATAPLRVRLRRPVTSPAGEFAAGEHVLSAADAAALVTQPAVETSELDHLVVVHAVLEGWLARLDGDALGLTEQGLVGALSFAEARAGEVVSVLDALSRRRVTFDTLDVTSMSLADEEAYTIDEAATAREMATLFPGLAFVPQDQRVRVEILNGTGRAGLASGVTARVVPAGARVVLTGNAARFGLEKTLVVLHDQRFAERAKRLSLIHI